VSIYDKGDYYDSNKELFTKLSSDPSKVKVHYTGVFRTLEVLIVGFLFCKHESYGEKEEAFWDLINPS